MERFIEADDDNFAPAAHFDAVGAAEFDRAFDGFRTGRQQEDFLERFRQHGGQLLDEIGTDFIGETVVGEQSVRGLRANGVDDLLTAVAGVGDEHAALAVLINRVANLIAQRTRRGAGNWAVVSSAALTVLQSATTSAFARTTEGTFEAPTNTKFVGTLNGAMKIYVDGYASDTQAVLVGYKGSSEADAAAFYCPYIPLMSSGVVLDPSTFEPVVSFMTRYGYVELTNTASSFGNAADYLGEIAVSNLSFQ